MRRSGHRRPRALLTAVSLLAASVAVGSGGGQAGAADVLPLTISGFDDIVAGPHWGALFISQGLAGDGVVVTDAEGQTQQVLADTAGSRHLSLSHDGATVWVALADAGEIAGFSTDTFAEVARYSMPAGVCPGSVAETVADMSPTGGGTDVRTLLAVGHACNQWGSGSSASGGVGVFDPATGNFEALTFAQPTYRPIVASSAGTGDFFVASDLGISPTKLVTVTSIGGFPDTITTSASTGGNLEDLAVAPDGSSVVQASGAPYQHNSYTLPFLESSTVYPSTNYPNAVAVSADGSRVATGTNSAYGDDVRIHDASTGETLRSVDLEPARLADGGLAFAPDGSVVYSVVTDVSGYGLVLLAEAPDASMTLVAPFEATYPFEFGIDGTLTFDGLPYAGLDIEITRQATGTAPVVIGVVQTTSHGTYRIVDAATQVGPVSYEARFAGLGNLPAASAQASMSVLYETNMTIDAPEQVMTGEPFDITGDLQLVGAGPLPGAEIRVERAIPGTTESELIATVITRSDGTYVFTDTLTEPGTVYYTLWYEGDDLRYPAYQSTYLYAQVGIDTTMTIAAPASADVGRQFDVTGTFTAADGRSTEGAWVSVNRTLDNGNSAGLGTATVTADGSWSITTSINVAGPADLTADFYGDDYLDPASASTTMQIEAPPAPTLTINAPSTAYVNESVRASGQLTDPNGNPLADRDVEIMQTDGVTGYTTFTDVVTDANGDFEYDYTPTVAGSQIVTARFDVGAPAPISRSAETVILVRPTAVSASVPSTVPVGDPAVITGSLVDQRSSGPVAGQSIFVSRSLNGGVAQLGSVTTAADGSFTLVDDPGMVGTATYGLSFRGGDVYGASATNVSVTFGRQASAVAVTATPLSGKRSKGKYTIAADFTDGGPARSISLFAQTPDGESLIATGSSISIVVQPSETTTYIARFAGDATYQPSDATVTVTVSRKGGGKPKK